MSKPRGICTVSNCGAPHAARGYCGAHYAMWRRWGDPLYSKQDGRRLSKLGSKNPQWKGEQVGLAALHDWVRARLPRPSACPRCNRENQWLDLANKSNRYLRDLSDWDWLCRKCHMESDGRLATFVNRRKERASNKRNSIKRFRRGIASLLKKVGGAYPDDPGTSDLDDEQPVSARLTLKDVRFAWMALRQMEAQLITLRQHDAPPKPRPTERAKRDSLLASIEA